MNRHRLQTERVDAPQLVDRVVDARHRHDGAPDQAVGCDCTVVLCKEGVVGLHQRPVYGAIGDALDKARSENRRIQHLGVDAVFVLLTQPLRGVAGAVIWCAIGLVVRRAGEADRTAAGDVLTVVQQRLAFDQPRFAARGQLQQPRRPITPLFGHIFHPTIGRRLHVPICRYHAVPSRHPATPLPSAIVTL